MKDTLPPPTCSDLFNELLPLVDTKDDMSWRHGSRRTEVFHRESDNTFWSAYYCVSTDGETNELREGMAEISRVVPKQVTTTIYEAV